MKEMSMVLNKRTHGVPAGSVYIGRPSKWGNPFVIGRDGDRAEVVRKYDELVSSDSAKIMEIQRELAGRKLVCFCAPLPCHGDVLSRIANLDDVLF